MIVPKTLAAYLARPADFSNLFEFLPEGGPPGARPEDWGRFRMVAERMDVHAGKLVLDVCNKGAEAFVRGGTRERGQQTSPAKAQQNWQAWVQLKKQKAQDSDGICIGCTLEIDDTLGEPALIAWVQPWEGKKGLEGLEKAIRRVPSQAREVRLHSEALVLRLGAIPLRADSTIDGKDGAVAQCAAFFEPLVEISRALP